MSPVRPRSPAPYVSHSSAVNSPITRLRVRLSQRQQDEARYPSGKGEVCKTFMRRFDPDPRLQFFKTICSRSKVGLTLRLWSPTAFCPLCIFMRCLQFSLECRDRLFCIEPIRVLQSVRLTLLGRVLYFRMTQFVRIVRLASLVPEAGSHTECN